MRAHCNSALILWGAGCCYLARKYAVSGFTRFKVVCDLSEPDRKLPFLSDFSGFPIRQMMLSDRKSRL